jgi:DNA-binding NarL/FixJ family response regulator
MNTIRVLLADDHPALRIGLRVLLDASPAIDVVAEVEDGASALQIIQHTSLDVAILDCQLPDLDGFKVAEFIRELNLPVQVLALSAYDDDQYLSGMRSAGASGYFLKSEAPKQIVDAVVRVYRGEELWTTEQLVRIGNWQNEIGRIRDSLTDRELEVLHLIALSLSNKEIAQKLTITVRTVDFHVSNILRKLDAVSRVEVAVWAQTYL